MALSGNLAEINLASVFQNLEQNTATGTLTVSVNKRTWPLFLEQGRVATVVPEDWINYFGPILARSSDLKLDDYQKVAVKLRRGQNLLTTLKRRRLADRDQLDSTLRFLQEECLYELFQLQTGEFIFAAGERSKEVFPPPFDKINLKINSNSILMEAARRSDELGQLQTSLGSLKGVYVQSPDYHGDVSTFSPEHQKLLSLLDGSRDIERLCRDSGFGKFQTCVMVAQFLERLTIIPARADDHVRFGDSSRVKGQIDKTTFHYQRALELRRTDSRTRHKLAEILAEAGQIEDAVTQYKVLATQLVDSSDWKGAAEAYQRAAQLAPKDVSLFEKLFDIYKQNSDLENAKSSGEQLAKQYQSLSLHEKSQQVFRDLRTLFPMDAIQYEQGIAHAYVSMGKVPEAVQSFHKAATDALSRSEESLAVRFLEEILKIDSQDASATDLLQDIVSGQREQRQKRWKLARRVVVYLILFLTVLAWVAYDNVARQQLHVVSKFCFEDVERGDFDAASTRLIEFRQKYPYTMADFHAESYQTHLAELGKRAVLRENLESTKTDDDH
ncbi:MAG: DUF4388 domain-containing protein [Planctomycetota bacterium]|nr:DUF4388 domain-containing protein [Planctomycetota bacterium]